MKWDDVRQHFPHQWLLVEATQAHTTANHRIVEDFAVVECFGSGETAMKGYSELHRKEPQRELYVIHTDREQVEITELNWLGIREAS